MLGQLSELESLDLSINNLFEVESPQAFLAHLHLVIQQIERRNPIEHRALKHQFLFIVGNLELCGSPLTKECPSGAKPLTLGFLSMLVYIG